MPALILLLLAEALVFRSMARSPFSVWLLLAWPMGVYVTGWTLYSVWERLGRPRRCPRDTGGSDRLHLGRLVVVALVLLVLAFTVTAVTTHAAPAGSSVGGGR